ncbi:MAG: DUF1684 domain-containing protein [Sphingobacteriales bacterium]|nr:MAG: DUF1684 domain-containing protein [Sphingobacteriales bacterium]
MPGLLFFTMQTKVLAFVFLLLPTLAAGQNYEDSIAAHRAEYCQAFITEKRSPLKAADTGFLRFFNPDRLYRVTARFTPSGDTTSFLMPTRSGKTKRFRKYGTASFRLKNGRRWIDETLEIYQSPDLMQQEAYHDQLFIPFTDDTNGGLSYGGGRYIDISTKDIANGSLVIDFNKAYNPYCAYAEGYNCPIPPKANSLRVPVNAGEKAFAGPSSH